MAMDSNPGKSGGLTSRNEIRGLSDRQADGHPDIYFHLARLLFGPNMSEPGGDHLLIGYVPGEQADIP